MKVTSFPLKDGCESRLEHNLWREGEVTMFYLKKDLHCLYFIHNCGLDTILGLNTSKACNSEVLALYWLPGRKLTHSAVHTVKEKKRLSGNQNVLNYVYSGSFLSVVIHQN
jgi:hypothetical protein